MNDTLLEKIRKIKLIAMDVDGTLTDGTIILDSRGVETKHFHVKDGMGITLARKAGLSTAIITARRSDIVYLRAKELHISSVKQGAADKVQALSEILEGLGIQAEETAFIGDDINDIPLCCKVGLSFAVHDASLELAEKVDYVLSKDGGRGAVREAIDLILKYKPGRK